LTEIIFWLGIPAAVIVWRVRKAWRRRARKHHRKERFDERGTVAVVDPDFEGLGDHLSAKVGQARRAWPPDEPPAVLNRDELMGIIGDAVFAFARRNDVELPLPTNLTITVTNAVMNRLVQKPETLTSGPFRLKLDLPRRGGEPAESLRLARTDNQPTMAPLEPNEGVRGAKPTTDAIDLLGGGR